MINRLHSWIHQPGQGWDPVAPEYASEYAESEWRNINVVLIDQLEQRIGGFSGKRVLDLGGGPGQYSVAFARRGARVTWHDVSRTYQKIAARHAAEAGVQIVFSLGYLEEADRLITDPFDFVFTRLAWCYCMNDRRFARLVYSLIKPEGAAYIESNTPRFENPRGLKRLVYFLNNWFGWKIGHPHPPHGRLASLLNGYPITLMIPDYSNDLVDKIFLIKGKVTTS